MCFLIIYTFQQTRRSHITKELKLSISNYNDDFQTWLMQFQLQEMKTLISLRTGRKCMVACITNLTRIRTQPLQISLGVPCEIRSAYHHFRMGGVLQLQLTSRQQRLPSSYLQDHRWSCLVTQMYCISLIRMLATYQNSPSL